MPGSSGSIVLRARGLRVRLGGQRVLDGLDWDVPRGVVMGLIGRNGSGKSTLLRALCGVVPSRSDELRVLGLCPRRQGARLRARLGVVQDRLELPRWMRVGQALDFTRSFHPTWCEVEQARLVEILGLDRRMRVRDLSRGKRAGLGLVLALAHRPEVSLLDEPFVGLDLESREATTSAIIEHLRESGRTVVLASHALSDLERVADQVAFLKDGRIVESGDLDELRSRGQGTGSSGPGTRPREFARLDQLVREQLCEEDTSCAA